MSEICNCSHPPVLELQMAPLPQLIPFPCTIATCISHFSFLWTQSRKSFIANSCSERNNIPDASDVWLDLQPWASGIMSVAANVNFADITFVAATFPSPVSPRYIPRQQNAPLGNLIIISFPFFHFTHSRLKFSLTIIFCVTQKRTSDGEKVGRFKLKLMQCVTKFRHRWRRGVCSSLDVLLVLIIPLRAGRRGSSLIHPVSWLKAIPTRKIECQKLSRTSSSISTAKSGKCSSLHNGKNFVIYFPMHVASIHSVFLCVSTDRPL